MGRLGMADSLEGGQEGGVVLEEIVEVQQVVMGQRTAARPLPGRQA